MYNYFPENMQSTYISLSRRSSAHLLQDKKKKRPAEQQQHRKKKRKQPRAIEPLSTTRWRE
jgi:hypothetical protein